MKSLIWNWKENFIIFITYAEYQNINPVFQYNNVKIELIASAQIILGKTRKGHIRSKQF